MCVCVCVYENDSQPLFSALHSRSLFISFFPALCTKNKGGFAYKQVIHYKFPRANIASMLISLFPVALLSQQQRKEREMVRQQEKGPHRRLDDMRREEDRRLAEREQVTNHRRRGAAISQSM